MISNVLRHAALTGVVTLTAVGLAACGGSGDHSSPGTGHDGAATSAATPAVGVVFNDADVTFAQMMVVHHQQAVTMAELADGRVDDAEVKTLTAKIKAAQGPEISTMTGWLTAWGKPTVAPTGAHGSGHQFMPGMMSDTDLAKLEAATGKTFDQQFCTMMIAHHEGAVTMAKDQLANGSNPDAKALAQKIITDQQTEIATMKAILVRL